MVKWQHTFTQIVMVLLIIGCGRRTPPKPSPTPPSIIQFQAKQYGQQVRLEWRMATDSLQKSQLGVFVLQAFTIPYKCISCTPQSLFTKNLTWEKVVMQGGRIFYTPEIEPSLNSILFQLQYESSLERVANTPQSTVFERFNLMPTPKAPTIKILEWDGAQEIPEAWRVAFPETPPKNLVKVSWNPPVQTHTFVLNLEDSAAPMAATQTYRANVYRADPNDASAEWPINSEPLSQNFYIDVLSEDSSNPQYQIRWVDAQGNESLPSP